jgi:hypothetical protein
MASALFLGLFLSSMACWLWMSTLSAGSKRGVARLTATLLMGTAFICPAVVALTMIHASPRFEVTGRIQTLVQRHGKNYSSTFEIERADGVRVRVNAGYAGDHLQNGETVVAKVLLYKNTLLRLRVLDGRFSDWEIQQGDGTLSAWLGIAFGSFFVIGGVRKWRSDPEAPEVQDDRAPLNGVDDQSLLHLNGK